MSQAIPRTLVAEVLGVAPDALPAGDLPVARLAERFMSFLRDSFAQDSGTDHPETWTFALYGALVSGHPDLALDTILAASALLQNEDEAALLASGPLDELINSPAGPALLPRLRIATAKSPRFGYLLAGVQPEGSAGTPFWREVLAMTQDFGSPDSDTPLPEV